ncbi:MAG: hypothetical protein H8E76_08545 [Helicobacteraceae bacterium]|nr:hypothetical protein [Candidatus Sulfurimonas ponti]MBL6973200.1 hypothetical protein [Sulfurimonas sp.]
MKILINTIALMAALVFTTSHASENRDHAGHNHPTHELLDNAKCSTEIQEIAKQEVQRLVLEKKIAKSWKSASILKMGKAQNSFTDDWVVVFENLKIKNKKRQNLYIFIGAYGEFAAANYTGR